MPSIAPYYLNLPYKIASISGLVIRQIEQGRLHATFRCDASPATLLEISQIVSLPIDLEIVSLSHFETCLSAHYGTDNADITPEDENGSKKEFETTIALIDAMVAAAIQRGATDFHVEEFERHLVVRVRYDGKLQEQFRLQLASSYPVIRRYKDRSQLDNNLPDTPQKGTLLFPFGGAQLEILVSILPGRMGERMVLGIPSVVISGVALDLPGMSPEIGSRLRHILTRSGGMIIVAGPVGSGVDNTLYTSLNLLNDGRRHIMTIENKIGHAIDGISQIEIERLSDDENKNSNALTETLKTVLLQDPDVVMLAHLQNRKTAEMAMHATLKGPLILTTMQCHGAIEVITALRELKIENMLIGESLRGILSQRVVKRLCSACRAPAQAAGSIASRLGFDRGTGIFEPRGCEQCGHSGFSGHIGVFEFVAIDDTLRRLISSGGDEAVISSYAFMNNPNLSSAARRLVISGETTAEEAIRIGQNS